MTIPPGFADVSVQITSTATTRPAFITFGVDPGSSDPNTIAGAVHAAIGTAGSLCTRIDSSCTYGPITVRLGQDGGEPLVGISNTTGAGTLGASSVPPNCAVLVHKRTARGGRRGRGRMFLPWAVAITDVGEGGIIAAGTVTTINTALEVFRNALSAATNPMVVLHDVGISAPGAPDVVTALLGDRLISTQRRRLGR